MFYKHIMRDPMYLVILLYALFASIFTLQKETLKFAEPFFLVGFRMSLAGLILLIYANINKQTIKIHKSHIKDLALLTMSAIYLTNVFEIWGLKHMASAKVCLIYSLSPFLAAFIAFVVLKETLSTKKWVGLIIGFIGLMPIMFTQTQQEFLSGTIFIFSFAELAVLIAVLCAVYGWIILKKILQQHHYSPIFANGISMLGGGILALIHSYFAGEWNTSPVHNWQPFLITSIITCLISNVICYNLYGLLLKRFSATFISFAGLVTPIFASLFGFVFLQEIISWHFFAAMFLFSIGLIIFHQEEIKLKEFNY
jgi:drug/metabolite transporter (DMT)-like permease